MGTINDNTLTELFSGTGIGTFRVTPGGTEPSPQVILGQRTTNNYFPFGILQSSVKDLGGAVSEYGNVSWTQTLETGTEIDFQTRSSNTDNGQGDDYASWEAWKPSEQIGVDDMDAVSGLVYACSNDNYFKTSQETSIKVQGTGSLKLEGLTTGSNVLNQYAERVDLPTVALSGVDFVSFKIRSDLTGTYLRTYISNDPLIHADTVTVSGLHYDITIDNADQWQQEFWNIRDIASADRDGVQYLGFKVIEGSSTFTAYVDDVKGGKFLSANTGEAIQSTPQRFTQYRALLSTTQ